MIMSCAMLKYIGLFLPLIVGGCEYGPYNAIVVDTGWGQEEISSKCFAWTDGCNIGCRTNNTTGYTIIQVKENCKDSDIHRSECIDDDSEKLKACPNDSANNNKY